MNTITELLTDLACAIDDLGDLVRSVDVADGEDHANLVAAVTQLRDIDVKLCASVFGPIVDLVAAVIQAGTILAEGWPNEPTDDETAEDIAAITLRVMLDEM
jgi:hypothetical protein